MKVLLATEKPFAKVATDGIRKIVEDAGMQLALLEKYSDPADLIAAVADADALIVRSDKVTPAVVEAAKNLKIVVRAGAGYDNLDLPSLSARKIVAMNTPGQNSNAVAELAIGMMIYMSRNQFNPGTGSELKGKTLGIQGWGNIGSLIAKYALGFGMNVYGYRHRGDGSEVREGGAIPLFSIKELYERSDFLSINIPATSETKSSIHYQLMNLLPKGAAIINTARKEVVHEQDLIKILEARPDLKYATDIAADCQAELNEKFGHRVFATPKKMGAETSEANINAGLAAATQIVEFLKEGVSTFQVNKF